MAQVLQQAAQVVESQAELGQAEVELTCGDRLKFLEQEQEVLNAADHRGGIPLVAREAEVRPEATMDSASAMREDTSAIGGVDSDGWTTREVSARRVESAMRIMQQFRYLISAIYATGLRRSINRARESERRRI